MRILHVAEPSTGGVARHVLDLTGAQLAAGHDVAAAVRADAPVAPGTRVARLAWQAPITAVGADARVLRSLVPLVRGFDVVHTHGDKGGVLGRLAARAAGIPVVHSSHGFAYLSQQHRERAGAGARRTLTLGIERALAPLARRIVCVSAWEREQALRDRIGAPEQLVVVPNGVRPAPAVPVAPVDVPPGDGPLVGFVARLNPNKDPHTFVDAVQRLGCRAVLCGEGPLAGEVRARGVPLLPWPGDAAPVLAALDVYVLSSLWESLPIGVLEAMAAGVAVVATDAGGVREAVLHERTGLLVPPRDPDALAAAIGRLIDDPALRARLAAAGREHVAERFSMGAMVAGIEDAYRFASASS